MVRDIFIIGGGINGVGIARDAVGRGYSVCLAEKDDLASGTSSASTKLIHGGLRYLEHYEFRLVREALAEREILWRNAPHIIQPMRFVLPLEKGQRPAWMIRFGLFLYDHIGGRKRLPPTRVLDMRSDPAAQILKSPGRRAFEYSDCTVDDARLVILNACDAASRGAEICTQTQVMAARVENGLWHVHLRKGETGEERTVRAKMLVNAAGPWVDRVAGSIPGNPQTRHVRLVQGSHIVIGRKFDGPRSYFFQNADGRIFFAIPYEDDFTLIGTTDRDYQGALERVKISQEEIDYLCEAASTYFTEPVLRKDIIWTFSGVRALFDDGATKAQEATRDYVLTTQRLSDAPLLNVYGGKITTYRRLAEAALEKLAAELGVRGPPWTLNAHLPGGDFGDDENFEALVARLVSERPFLAVTHLRRLARLYGSSTRILLKGVTSLLDLGTHFGGDLYEREVCYLIENEWARSAKDILWRRTKLGLHFDERQRIVLDDFVRDMVGSKVSRNSV